MSNQSQPALTSIFNEKWEIVEHEFAKIVELEMLPVTQEIRGEKNHLTIEKVSENLNCLREKKFTIAVCGAVKTGKSTFLNALLFGDNILPSFDTPLTAKLTFIQHTDKNNYFEATFYDELEWSRIVSDMPPEAKVELDERIKFCGEIFGITKRNMILPVRRSPMSSEDLTELVNFVSVPSKEQEGNGSGKYTPFVKSVTIYINNKSLKNIQIVDTPGLNDPNSVNSQETINWIQHAHALIYLLKVKGPDVQDIEFFDKYLPHAPSSSRIFVQNQIDTIPDDYRSAVDYIRGLGKKDAYIRRKLFGKEETICSYSGLIALLTKKQQHNMTLTDDEKFAFDQLDTGFKFDPDGLEEVIAKKLYSNEGRIRLDSGSATIKKIYQYNIDFLEQQIAHYEITINDCNKSLADLEKDINKNKNFKSKLDSNIEDIRDELDEKFRDFKNTLEDELKHAKSSIEMRSNNKIEGYTSTKEIISKFSYDIIDASHEELKLPLKNAINKLTSKVRVCLKETEENLRAIAHEAGACDIDNIIIRRMNFNINDILNDAIKDFECATSKEKLQIPLPENWFTELFVSMKTIRAEAIGIFRKSLKKLKEDVELVIEKVNDDINKEADGLIYKIAEQAHRRIEDMEKIKSQSQQEKKTKVDELNKYIKVSRERLLHVEKSFKQFQCKLLD